MQYLVFAEKTTLERSNVFVKLLCLGIVWQQRHYDQIPNGSITIVTLDQNFQPITYILCIAGTSVTGENRHYQLT